MNRSALLLGVMLLAGHTWVSAQEPVAVPAAAAAPASRAYKVDPAKTQIYAIVLKDGVASAVAHDHVIAAKDSSGTVIFAAGDPKNSIEVTVNVNSFQADEASMRKKAGLGEGPSADDARTVETNMKAADQLNVGKYPTMTFKSTTITPQGGDKYQVEGKFTLHGVTKDVKFTATAAIENGAWHGKGKLVLKQSDYGFQPYSALFGAIKNKDPITLYLDIWAQPN